MSESSKAAAAAAAGSSTKDAKADTVANAAAAAARSRIQQANPPNKSYVDHVTGSIKEPGNLPAFWLDLQQSGGWLAAEKACMHTDSKTAFTDIISTHTKTYVCNPLVRQARAGAPRLMQV
jgi:hypothetical protein